MFCFKQKSNSLGMKSAGVIQYFHFPQYLVGADNQFRSQVAVASKSFRSMGNSTFSLWALSCTFFTAKTVRILEGVTVDSNPITFIAILGQSHFYTEDSTHNYNSLLLILNYNLSPWLDFLFLFNNSPLSTRSYMVDILFWKRKQDFKEKKILLLLLQDVSILLAVAHLYK